MARRALKVCSKSGCPELVESGRCVEHRRLDDRARGTASERGYNSAGHRRFRRAVLLRDPICVSCATASSTVADHYPTSRRDLVVAGLDPNAPERGRGMCKSCHDKATATNQPGGFNAR
jgi:5-methylcytosine-specific restriction protein A